MMMIVVVVVVVIGNREGEDRRRRILAVTRSNVFSMGIHTQSQLLGVWERSLVKLEASSVYTARLCLRNQNRKPVTVQVYNKHRDFEVSGDLWVTHFRRRPERAMSDVPQQRRTSQMPKDLVSHFIELVHITISCPCCESFVQLFDLSNCIDTSAFNF